MPFVIAVTMLTAVALSLTAFGTLGACLAGWQLGLWALFGGVPFVADVWRHTGLAGSLLVDAFEHLPRLLAIAVGLHTAVAWLGLGLLLRRRWAWTAAIAFGALWMLAAVGGGLFVRYLLNDLAAGYPEHAGFAAAAMTLAVEVACLNALLGAALIVLIVQPSVRVQFGADR